MLRSLQRVLPCCVCGKRQVEAGGRSQPKPFFPPPFNSAGRYRPSGSATRAPQPMRTATAVHPLPPPLAVLPPSSRSQGALAVARATARAAAAPPHTPRCFQCGWVVAAMLAENQYAQWLLSDLCTCSKLSPLPLTSPPHPCPHLSLQELPELEKSDADFYRDWGITREREVGLLLRRGAARALAVGDALRPLFADATQRLWRCCY